MSFWGNFLDAGKAILFPRLWEIEQRERARQQRRRSTPQPGGPRPISVESEQWSKYSSSEDADTGQAQTDYYVGFVGEHNGRRKVHIAINDNGDVIYVRDIDGTVLYDRKRGVGHLPSNLDWSE